MLNPTYEQRENSSLDFVIAGHADGVVMIEGEASILPEEKIVEALRFGHESLIPISEIQRELQKEVGKTKAEVEVRLPNGKVLSKIKDMFKSKLMEIYQIDEKIEREEALDALIKKITDDMSIFDKCREGEEDEIRPAQSTASHRW